MPDIFTIRSHEIGEHWFWIEPHLKRVASPDWTLDQVKSDLESASAQLWSLLDDRGSPAGAIITRIESYHDTVYGVIWIAAGRGLECSRPMLDAIEDWFRSMGCSRCELRGRKGWERVLPDYELKAVVLSKEL